MTTRITKTVIDSTPRPKRGTIRLFDSEIPGFGVDIGKTKVTFFVRRRVTGRIRKSKIGEFPAVTLHQARELARPILARMALGEKPSALNPWALTAGDAIPHPGEGCEVPTLKKAIDTFLEERAKSGRKLKASTIADMRTRLDRHLSDWYGGRITQIKRKDTMARHAKLTADSGAVSANVVMRYLSSVLNWSSERFGDDDEPLLIRNPVRGMRRLKVWNREKRRQSHLDEAKFKALWAAIERLTEGKKRYLEHSETVADFLRFLAFVGMRPGEAARLRTENVDLAKRCFVLHDTKTRNDFYLPFAAPVEQILRRRLEYAALAASPYIFPSTGRTKREFLSWRGELVSVKKSVPKFMLTDFRRTLTTIAANLNPPLSHLTIKRLLNHTTENIDSTDVTAGYYATDIEWLREPVERIANRVLELTAETRSAQQTSG